MPAPIYMVTTFPPRERLVPEALAGSLGPNRQVIDLDGPSGDQSLRDPDEWIDHYRRKIEALSEPPTALLGYSWGGIVALELASWLRSAGHPTTWVGMIDSWRPAVYPRTVGEKFVAMVSEFGARAPDQRRPYLEEEARRIVSYRWGQLTNRVMAPWRPPPPQEPEPESRDEALMRAVKRAWVKYVVHSVDFHVSLFTCDKSIEHYHGDPSLGWAPFLLGGFDTTQIDGDHFTLFEPDNVGSLIWAVNRSLARAGLRDEMDSAEGRTARHALREPG